MTDGKNIAALNESLEYFAASGACANLARLYDEMMVLIGLTRFDFSDPYLDAFMSGGYDRLWNYRATLMVDRDFVQRVQNPYNRNRVMTVVQFKVHLRGHVDRPQPMQRPPVRPMLADPVQSTVSSRGGRSGRNRRRRETEPSQSEASNAEVVGEFVDYDASASTVDYPHNDVTEYSEMPSA